MMRRALVWFFALVALASLELDVREGGSGSAARGRPVRATQDSAPAPVENRVIVTDTNPLVIESTPVAPPDFEVADLAALVSGHDFSAPVTPAIRAVSSERWRRFWRTEPSDPRLVQD